MPTDSFAIAWAGPIATGSRSVGGSYKDASDLTDSIASTLIAGGWTQIELTYPRQFLFYYGPLVPVLGEPIPFEQRQVAPCWAPMFQYGPAGSCGPQKGARIVGFDPGRSLPPPCDAFAYGPTQGETVAALAGEISATVDLGAGSSVGVAAHFGDYGLGLWAKVPGTEFNGYCAHGDPWGSFTHTAALWGGGYRLRSQTYNGTYIEVVITAAGEGGSANQVRIDWAVNSAIIVRDDAWPSGAQWPVRPGQEVSFLTTHAPHTYTIWACPYQFAVWARDVDGDTGGQSFTTACLCSIPRVPVEHPGYGQAIILPHYYPPWQLSVGNMRTSLTYSFPLLSVGSTIYNPGSNNVGIAGLRLPGHPLLTAEGKPILNNPYVWTRFGDREGIIGQLWNCVLCSSDQFPRDSTMFWDNQKYLCMSKQTAAFGRAVGGLWLAVN